MTNKEKLEALKAFLTGEKIDFKENYVSNGTMFALYVEKYRIAVRLSDENDQNFFYKTRKYYHPFFIRDNESTEFVIEKMQNCIRDILMDLHKNHQNIVKKSVVEEAPSKPKRRRIPFNKVERITPTKKS